MLRLTERPIGREVAMPKRLVFIGILLLLLSATAFAQNPNDFLRMFGGIMQQGMIQAAQSEWRRLSPDERACLDQSLRQQGASVDALINRGVFPNDSLLAQVRSDCRTNIAQAQQSQTAPSSPYVVDGLALGGRVRPDSDAYR
jgi:hypothetical protein